MKINSDLAYYPVTYSELTTDEKFWSGCKGCINYNILIDKQFKNCLCTAMLYLPNKKLNVRESYTYFSKRISVNPKMQKAIERFTKLKQSILIKNKYQKNEQ